jgi:hypothetical protein
LFLYSCSSFEHAPVLTDNTRISPPLQTAMTLKRLALLMLLQVD